MSESNLKRITGKVISDHSDKTIVILVVTSIKHKRIGKYIKRNKKIHAHDESNQAKNGDIVTIEECRPISKQKSWRLVKIDVAHIAGEA